jgi:predicted RNase H-like HicB family nuclease
MKNAYSATFQLGEDGVYHVRVPDIPSCVTFGHTLNEALESASDALNLVLVGMEDLRLLIPEPTPIQAIDAPSDGFVSLIGVDTDAYRRSTDQRAVHKNVSIPAWMDAESKKRGFSLSQILQDALRERLALG